MSRNGEGAGEEGTSQPVPHERESQIGGRQEEEEEKLLLHVSDHNL